MNLLLLLLAWALVGGGGDDTALDALLQCRQRLMERLPLRASFVQELWEEGVVTLSERGVLALGRGGEARWAYHDEAGRESRLWVIRNGRYSWYQPEDRLLRVGHLGEGTQAGLWAWLLKGGDLSTDGVRVVLERPGLLRLEFPQGELWWLQSGADGLPLEMRTRSSDNPAWMTAYRFSSYQDVASFPAGTFELSVPEGTEVIEEP